MAGLAIIATLIVAVVPAAGGTDPRSRSAADEWLFTCGDGPFKLDVFDAPATAEQEDSPAAAALREAIAERPLVLPSTGWRVLIREQNFVQFGHGKPRGPADLIEVGIAPTQPSGRWSVTGGGDCSLNLYSERLHTAGWKPRHPAKIKATDTTIKAFVTEHACVAGQSPDGRIRPPRIAYEEGRIVIAPFVEPPPRRFETCPGNPPGKYTFRLSEPIGDRVVADGSAYPFKGRVGGGG